MFSFADMLSEYGIPLVVYAPPTDENAGHIEHGTWVKDDLEPVEVSEPLVVPSESTRYSMATQFGDGGQTQSFDAVWYSVMTVPDGTTVENKRSGIKYTVLHCNDYSDYSDVRMYELKGASNHGQ